MIHRRDISVTGTSGGWINITASKDGRVIEKRYLYYTKREAILKFLEEVNS